ncbi:MAG: twin-arginine translocation signal domain-containing protein, partial [Candidatus Aminicenantes bacterium]|nr:twin-arginine translocation signal domain-containing protein [Candidatus Aminicenantes bacterium]
MGTSRRQFLKNLSMGIGGFGVFGLAAKEAQANIRKKLEEIGHLPV